jgi:predicted aspartyl protease
MGVMSAGCATISTPTLEEIAFDPNANRLDVSRMEDGLLTIPVSLDGGEPQPFILDTGATRSVLFRDVLPDLAFEEDGAVRVHGLFGSGVMETVNVGEVKLGTHMLEDLSFIVLPQRILKDGGGEDPVGIVGMDILSNYRLFSLGKRQESGTPNSGELILLKAEGEAPRVPVSWTRIPLNSNPFGVEAQALRFMDVRLNGKVSAALLDTGSAVNVLSYEFADYPMVRMARKRLERQFELQGALETFRPRILVNELDFRAGSRNWYDQPFIVKDVDSLEILGVKDKPFMIAGVGLLADEVFYLDLAGNELRMPRAGARAFSPERDGERSQQRVDPRTGSRVGGSSSTVIQVSPSGRTR